MKKITFQAVLLAFLSCLLFSCDNDINTQEEKKELTNQTSTPTEPAPLKVEEPTELLLSSKYLGEDENGNPRSNIVLKIDTKEKKIATVMGKAQTIAAAQYADFGIPNTATSACSSWHAGAGDYFYSVFKNNEVMVYKGWQDEMQEKPGYHWEPMDWNE
jgi:hypothetical protein